MAEGNPVGLTSETLWARWDRAESPAAYAAVGTAGMLCARLVRGSQTGVSHHARGTGTSCSREDEMHFELADETVRRLVGTDDASNAGKYQGAKQSDPQSRICGEGG